MGKLSSEECARFEEHFVDCPRCVEQLETSHDLRQAFKTVVAQDAARSRFAVAPVTPFERRTSRWRPVLLAVAACLMIVAVPAILLVRQARLGSTGLDQANAAAESWHRQYVEEQQANADLKKQLGEAEQKAGPNRNLSVAAAASPMATLVFTLETSRGGESTNEVPVNQVEVSRSVQSIVLSVDREDLGDARSYDATVTDSHGHIQARLSNLEPSAGISVPAAVLHAGDYLLTVQGHGSQGNTGAPRRYPFRVKLK
jgi:hypothetical protein